MKTLQYILSDEAATVRVGQALALIVSESFTKTITADVHQAKQGLVVYLNGDLGAGKTTLTRGFVRGMGHTGHVKSPTYTLVEPYELPPWRIYHFDLYRLSDPEELEYMGIRDYFADDCCCFIEWSEKGAQLLAPADIVIDIAYQQEQRHISLLANSSFGEYMLLALSKRFSE